MFIAIKVVLDGGIIVNELKRDFSKLERIYEKYKGIIFKEAWAILHNENDVEDAVQKTFENLTKCCDRIEDVDSPRTCGFIKIVARNAAIDIRKEKVNIVNMETSIEFLEDIGSAECADSLEILIQKESVRIVIEAIKKLLEKLRDVVILEKVLGYTRAETMQLLGEKNETLKKRLTRARNKLLDKLRKDDLR